MFKNLYLIGCNLNCSRNLEFVQHTCFLRHAIFRYFGSCLLVSLMFSECLTTHLQISNECLPSILKLPYLEHLILEGCFGIDDDNLSTIKHGCKSLKVFVMKDLAAELLHFCCNNYLRWHGRDIPCLKVV